MLTLKTTALGTMIKMKMSFNRCVLNGHAANYVHSGRSQSQWIFGSRATMRQTWPMTGTYIMIKYSIYLEYMFKYIILEV